ncbi:LrgB family protein [Alteromonas sp. ASW11-36]|uniref:LrgB family protein n=1 Tax=Alteromonas arenosi TaxID=3055817 RepID=A0ABT7T0J4_9ALTE|nr:LrgB family protein [Alteromonas sp. ASW11-36]MDM7861931.1 LrgB family protein [Alteromonas sp. ASW11-36]
MSTEHIVQVMLWSVVTGGIYCAGLWLYKISRSQPLLHPIVTSATAISVLIFSLGISLTNYLQATHWFSWLLNIATVALAIPMYQQIQVIRHYGWRVWLPIIAGGIAAPGSAWLFAWSIEAPEDLQMTLLAKSITTPLAIDVAGAIGGIPALAAVIVILTGLVGAVFAPWLFRFFNITNPIAAGVGLGTAAHAIGTARAVQMGQTTTAVATLALCINGIATAVVLPLLFG